VTGDELQRLRKRLGLTQVELAARVGVTRVTIGRQERGEVRIPEPTARLIRLLVQTAPKATRKRGGR
jgi:transcriptional regulator with XRE-family HTH domain